MPSRLECAACYLQQRRNPMHYNKFSYNLFLPGPAGSKHHCTLRRSRSFEEHCWVLSAVLLWCSCTTNEAAQSHLRCRAGSKHHYTLRRSGPSDEVTGTIALGFAWDITARSLLLMKLATLERVLAQRVEILCLLRPTAPRVVQAWVEADAQPHDAEVRSVTNNLCQLSCCW